MTNKLIQIIIAVTLVVGGGAFYAGMKYGQNNPINPKQGNFSAQGGIQGGQNLTPEQRQQRAQQLSAGNGAKTGIRAGGGFTTGEIVSKDNKSITLKLQDGGSKIIFLSNSTEITKSANGDLNDIEIGKNINVNGSANSDGSISAQTIQIRPTQ